MVAKDWQDSFKKRVLYATEHQVGVQITKAAEVARKAVNSVGNTFFLHVGLHFMGVSQAPKLPFFAKWEPLSFNYAYKKHYGRNANRRHLDNSQYPNFFKNSGDLKRAMYGISDASRVLGTSRVEGRWTGDMLKHSLKTRGGRAASTYKVVVRPFGNWSGRNRGYAYNNDLTTSSAAHDLDQLVSQFLNDPKAYKKLRNIQDRREGGRTVQVQGEYRPLLLPALMYFIKYKMPRAAARALKDAGYAVRTKSNG